MEVLCKKSAIAFLKVLLCSKCVVPFGLQEQWIIEPNWFNSTQCLVSIKRSFELFTTYNSFIHHTFAWFDNLQQLICIPRNSSLIDCIVRFNSPRCLYFPNEPIRPLSPNCIERSFKPICLSLLLVSKPCRGCCPTSSSYRICRLAHYSLLWDGLLRRPSPLERKNWGH